ncbi:hypothetical protein BBJ28_00008748 [Nothophytophthora sp. Chile5]|nr:hypothetical protein BBJ28_00008748 [Nothophytophthora sp. Chile5]
MANSGDDTHALSLDDMALSADLLPAFLDELSDGDLLPALGPLSAPQTPLNSASYSDSDVVMASASMHWGSPFHQYGNEASANTSPPPSYPLAPLFQLPSNVEPAAVSRELIATPAHEANAAVKPEEQALAFIGSAQPRPPMQNSTRKRQKAELVYLRDKVEALEVELTAKRRELMTSKNDDTLAVSVHSRGRRARLSRWQRVAKHQLVEKQRTEMLNLQLRASLTDQIKLARSLQKLLKKHTASQNGETEVALLHARLEFSNCRDGVSEASLYETLLRNMDSVYAEVDAVCARHPTMRSMEEGGDVSSLHVGETEAIFLEATSSKVIPFGFEETCSAIWRCLSRDHVKLADGTYHGVASSPDSIRAKAIMTLRVNSAQARMQMRFAMKKFVEGDRVVLTLESASESEGPRDLLHGLKMMERGWVVIRRVPIASDDEDCDHDIEAPEETIIQLCMRLTPSLSAGVLDAPGQRTGALTELILAAVHRNIGWLFQTVENILMEQALAAPAS